MNFIEFYKYHGLGNDFIIIDEIAGLDYNSLAINICNRHIGIGGDGLIIVKRKPLTMIIYNQDGSLATMCGNGLRCFARYVADKNYVNTNKFIVKTNLKDYSVEVINEDIKVEFTDISYDPRLMDIDTSEEKFLDKLVLNSRVYAVHTGTNHLVTYVEDLEKIDEAYAKSLHEHPIFKKKTNVNFVKIIDNSNLEVRTYERGVGFTNACGTGAIATFVISRLLGIVESKIVIKYKYGSLLLEEANNKVNFVGPAIQIAQGNYNNCK